MADALAPVVAAAPAIEDNKQRLRSLRARLLMLIVGIAAPLLGLAVGAVWQAHLSERTRVEARLLDVARAVASAVDDELRQSEVYLRVIASSPSLAVGDWVSVYQQARQSMRGDSLFTLHDAQGRRILDTSYPLPEDVARLVEPRAAELVRRVLAENRFVVSNVLVQPSAGAGIVIAAMPAATRGGQRVVIAQILSTRQFASALSGQSMPADWISAVLDAGDAVVTRSRDDARFVGTYPSPAMREAMRAGPSGLVRTNTVENLAAVLAYARAPASGFAGLIAIPEAVFRQAFLSTIGPVAMIGLSLVAAAMGIAMLASSRILAAVRRDYAVERSRREQAAESLREKDAELQQSERRFQTIADAMPQIVWSTGPAGQPDYVNDRWYHFTGMAPGSEVGAAWTELVHPDDRNRTASRWRHSLDTGEPFEIEHRLRARDGSYRWFMGRAVPIRDRRGRIERWFGTSTDIHDKKLAEQALVTAQVQLEARVLELESLYHHAPIGLAVIDRELRYLRVNDALAAMNGLPASDHIGRSVVEIAPQTAGQLRPLFEKVLAGQTFRNVELETHAPGDAEARRIWRAHFYPVRQDASEVVAIGAICEDVTAARKIDEALAEEKSRLERLMISAPNMIYITDLRRRRNAFINPQVFDSLGYAPAELTGRAIRALNALVHPDDRPRLSELGRAVRRAADGEICEAEYRIRHADGSYRWFLIRETPFQRDAMGRVAQVLGTGLDITVRRQADEHQQMLIRELHHRVKNILATVQAIASATGRSSKSFEEFRDDFSSRLISLGRTHSLLTREAWAGADLHDILNSELEPYLGGSSSRVTIEGPHVTVPRDMAVSVGMAVHELTTNAVKYGSLSVPEGRVHVSIATDGAEPEPRLTMIWTERGGPPVKTPDRRGFGSLLLNRLLASQLGGQVAIDYQPAGIVARLELVLRRSDRR